MVERHPTVTGLQLFSFRLRQNNLPDFDRFLTLGAGTVAPAPRLVRSYASLFPSYDA